MNFGLFNDYIDSGIGDNADAFPSDPNEDTHSDEDGIGDNADEDDDDEGIGVNFDFDDDNDGIPDRNDDFPTISKPTLIPAQAITPNGDGNNETWVIPGFDNYPDNKVSVYKRWGHPVYEVNGYANDYEGFFNQNRVKLPRGSYLYVIDLGDGGVLLDGWIFINY